MSKAWTELKLGNVISQRKEFITIKDTQEYMRCKVQLHTKGIILRDRIMGSEIKTKKQQVCKAGEFLVAEIDAKVGGFGIVPDILEGSIVSNHYFLFVIDTTKLDCRFLDYYTRTPAFKEQINAQGSTNYAAIKSNDVLNYTIPLPPLAEQQRIVARIESLAARITEAQKLRVEVDEEAKILLDTIIEKVFFKFENIEHKLLKELTLKIGSGSTPSGGRASYPSSGIPLIRSMNVRMRYFKWDDIAYIDEATHEAMARTKVKPNDVLLNITGASIGRIACVPDKLVEANVNQHVSIIRPINTLDPRFLMYFLSQPSIQIFINNEQKGATRQGFTKAQIEKFKIPILPLTEQHRIVTYLDNLHTKIQTIHTMQKQTNTELNAMLPAILDRAFKGEL